jgi:hypothetical protein
MSTALRAFAAAQLDESLQKWKETPLSLDDREDAIGRWIHHLIDTGGIPDEILEGMLEVSRSDAPYISPQMYECGCVAVTRITDRERDRHEKPFEMRLALPCTRPCCELTTLRQGASP